MEVRTLLKLLSKFITNGEIDEGYNGFDDVFDIDGNNYNFAIYGDQVWTVENAKMVTYRDGTPIPQVTDNTEWANLTTGAWSYYNNDPTKPRLYNWYAVMGIHDTDPNTPNKAFSPEGWHVPSDAEWTTLENYLAAIGYNNANSMAVAMASNTGWTLQGLNNSSGFNAFPEGFRYYDDGSFYNEGSYAFFWSSTEYSTNGAWDRNISFEAGPPYLDRYGSFKHSGFSVRFVRD